MTSLQHCAASAPLSYHISNQEATLTYMRDALTSTQAVESREVGLCFSLL